MIYISILEDKLKLTIIQNGERVLGMSRIIIIFLNFDLHGIIGFMLKTNGPSLEQIPRSTCYAESYPSISNLYKNSKYLI